MYCSGQGVKRDYAQARMWWEKGAAQGCAFAQYNLGVMYHFGQGVVQDYANAKEWFGRACDNGLQQGCDAYKQLNR